MNAHQRRVERRDVVRTWQLDRSTVRQLTREVVALGKSPHPLINLVALRFPRVAAVRS